MVKRNRKEEGFVLLNPTSSWLHSHRLELQTASCTVGTVDTCLYLAPKSSGRGPFDTPKLFAYILREMNLIKHLFTILAPREQKVFLGENLKL